MLRRAIQKRSFSNYQTKILINNKWVPAQSGKTFGVINPSTEQEICQVSKGGEADVDLAVKAARDAFEGPEWRSFGDLGRRGLLQRFADNITKNAEELATIESTDNGKPFKAALGETHASAEIMRYYAGWTEKMAGQTLPVSGYGPFQAHTKNHPVGVCGQIVPWNYPILMAAMKIAPVLTTGCTAVLKPAENTPLTALKLGELLVASGMPEGVINIVPGFGADAGQALVDHTDVDKITFTGSTAVGKKIMADASHTLKRVGLELGGKSANIILDDADIEVALQQAIYAGFLNSGQFCMSGSRLFVQEGIYDEFVERFVQLAQERQIGDAFEEGVESGPQISQAQLDKIMGLVETGVNEGATLRAGGKRIDRPGFYHESTVFTDVTDDMTIAKEEIFGPVVSILKFKTIDEAIQRANAHRYGLAGGVVTQSLDKALKVSNGIRAGLVHVNCWTGPLPPTPFGGFRESGIGRELGQKALDGYLEHSSILIKTSL